MNPFSLPKKHLLRFWAKRNLAQFEKTCLNPAIIYQKTWNKYLQFPCIKNLPDSATKKSFEYLRSLPLTTYADYASIFEKTLTTKFNPLVNEKINFWICSTGSVGVPKTFPMTKSVEDVFGECYKFRPSQLINEFDIYIGAPEMIFVMPGEKQSFAPTLPMGQIGYYYYGKIPKLLERKFLFSKYLYQNEEQFNQWHMLASLLSDSKGITSSIPFRILHFLNQINESRAELIQILKNNNWPKEISQFHSKKRIEYILKVLEKPIKSVKELWPSMNFIICWQAGESCQRQLNELKRNYDFAGIRFVDQIYNSSEGAFNLPMINEIGGPVMPHGIILEFMEEETGNFFWPWELEKNKYYEIVLTNAMGLTRYRTNDKVICTGHFGKLGKIAFHSRIYPEISLGWALIREEDIVHALEKSQLTNFSKIYFSVNEQGSGLTLFSTEEIPNAQLTAIDKILIELNPNYGKQIANGNVTALNFKFISADKFNEIMLKNANGKRLLIK